MMELILRLQHKSLLRAAKANKYGNTGTIKLVNKIVIIAPIGSTKPDNVPSKNAFFLDIPSLFSGIEIIAPSGKFCIAIPYC